MIRALFPVPFISNPIAWNTRRWTALVALVTFVLGNVGWPSAPLGTATQKTRSALQKNAKGGCCCAAKGKTCGCGCCKRPLVSNRGGCCGKKPVEKSSPIAAITCPCGGSPTGDLVVSTLPKLFAAVVSIPQMVEISAVQMVTALRPGQLHLPPDTPPPRFLACA